MTEISPLRRRMVEDMTVRNLSPATQRLPALRTGDFPGGIRRSADKIIQLLRADAGSAPRPATQAASSGRSSADTSVWPAIALGVFGVGLLIFYAVRGGAACRGMVQLLFMLALSGMGGSSRGRSSPFSGGWRAVRRRRQLG